MKQRINVLTLGVNDLEKSMKFYTDGLGWKTQGIIGTEFENGEVVLFELGNGMVISLYERKNLAWDSKLKLQPESATEFSIGYFVNNDKEVDAAMEQAQKAGARIIKPAQKLFGEVTQVISRTQTATFGRSGITRRGKWKTNVALPQACTDTANCPLITAN